MLSFLRVETLNTSLTMRWWLGFHQVFVGYLLVICDSLFFCWWTETRLTARTCCYCTPYLLLQGYVLFAAAAAAVASKLLMEDAEPLLLTSYSSYIHFCSVQLFIHSLTTRTQFYNKQYKAPVPGIHECNTSYLAGTVANITSTTLRSYILQSSQWFLDCSI